MTEIDELKVPIALRPVVEEIFGIIDAACMAVLDEEYADLARRAAAKLARKRPSPLAGPAFESRTSAPARGHRTLS